MDSWRLASTFSSPSQGTAGGRQLGSPGCLKTPAAPCCPSSINPGSKPMCGCAHHICYGAGSASLQPSQFSLPSVRVGGTEHGAGSDPSLASPRLCRIKVLPFWTGCVSASPKPWRDGVEAGGTHYAQQIVAQQGPRYAWPRRSHLCGSCRVRASPHPIPPC